MRARRFVVSRSSAREHLSRQSEPGAARCMCGRPSDRSRTPPTRSGFRVPGPEVQIPNAYARQGLRADTYRRLRRPRTVKPEGICSRNDLFEYGSADVSQLSEPARMQIGEAAVVQAQQVEDGGMHIAHWN